MPIRLAISGTLDRRAAAAVVLRAIRLARLDLCFALTVFALLPAAHFQTLTLIVKMGRRTVASLFRWQFL